MAWEIFVKSDLFDAGRHPEDGSQLEGISFTVVAQNERGARYAHTVSFSHSPCSSCIGAQMEDCEAEGGPCRRCDSRNDNEDMTRQGAEAAAEKLAGRVRAAKSWSGPVNNPNWTEIPAAYGSRAYQSGDWEAHFVELEKKEAEFNLF